ncbi:branched-chain amino acid ABC transporter permease [Olsenella sp. TM06-36]|nr:branched-chain amino acid ABC transporter permease [Olsenella sp. TM06-36]RHJ92355.1 branched-chain amino acid ABC transporter permease [Olsenella sp. AM05-7]RHJ97386.1 branched-chain amino acid ABC transporter permease [Olsenella sp. AM05-17]
MAETSSAFATGAPAGVVQSVRRSAGLLARHGEALREGILDGVPIALGYLAVSFSLGIAARKVGLDAVQGFFASLFNNASAGEYAGFAVIGAGGSLLEMAVVMLVANARYLLMSCSMAQRFSPDTPIIHRVLVGFDLTDELFGIAIARPGEVDPYYSYGAMVVALPGWAFGGMAGVIAGSVLPERVVSALSVALFGMFLAIIIPPARKSRVVAGLVLASFATSALFAWAPLLSGLSEGVRTIILTVALSALAAALFPVDEKDAGEKDTDVAGVAAARALEGDACRAA